MSYETILVEKNGPIAKVTLNRPDKLNAFSSMLIEELYEATKAIGEDDEVKVFILDGAGRAFSAGVDLKETSADNFGDDTGLLAIGNRFSKILESMPKVTIAQVHGFCFTGALEVALMFDLLYCDKATQFGDTHAKWAIMPRWGMTQRLARRVGINKAKELTFRALRFDGVEAEKIGLANQAFEKGQLESEVSKIVEDILTNSQQAIAAIKVLYNQGWYTTLREGLKIEQAADPKLSETEDMLNQFETKKNQ